MQTNAEVPEPFSLTREKVTSRLAAYSQPDQVLPIASALGSTLLDEQLNRTSALESKATTGLGFAVIALAFLLEQPPAAPLEIILFVVTLISASSAALFVYFALRVTLWPWFTDAIWLPEPTWLRSAEHLQAHYVDYQHQTLCHLQPLNKWKATCLQRCQTALAFTAAALAVRAVLLLLARP
jgi:hypothetical protein